MELRNIKSFIKVAEFENFSKAAEALGYAQSTITTQIQQLEEELGVPLFDRIGKRVVLSEKGRTFLEHANQMLKIETEAIEAVSENDIPSGILPIGTLESIASSFLAELLAVYIEKYPKVQIVITVGVTLELYDFLEKGLLDVVFLFDRSVYRPALKTVYSKSSSAPFIAPANHPLAHAENIPPERLLEERVLLTEKRNNYRQAFDELALGKGLHLEGIQEIASSICILQFVEKGLGISLLPDYALHAALQEKKISLFTVEGFDIRMDLQVLYHRQKFVSLAMKRFTETVEDYLSSLET